MSVRDSGSTSMKPRGVADQNGVIRTSALAATEGRLRPSAVSSRSLIRGFPGDAIAGLPASQLADFGARDGRCR